MLTTERNARGHKLKTQGQTKPQVYVVHGKERGLAALFWKLKVVFIFCLAHKEYFENHLIFLSNSAGTTFMMGKQVCSGLRKYV